MKRIGLIGGLSPESTVHYYQLLCHQHNQRWGGLNFPEITLESLNLQRLVDFFRADDWDSVATILLKALQRLKEAGADFAAILANTPHNAYEQIRESSPLKIITIMDATSKALVCDGRKKVALLGTRPTMEFGFFPNHFSQCGIETCVPTSSDRQELDRIVWEELSHGKILPESRMAAKNMIAELEQAGAEAVILGCTELGLLLQAEDTPLPMYDTLRLHAEAILDYASSGE